MSYQVNSAILKEIFDINVDNSFICDVYGFVDSCVPNTITYLNDIKYLGTLNSNPNIKVVITTKEYQTLIDQNKIFVLTEDPLYIYWSLVNHLSKSNYKQFPSRIDKTAQIHPKSFISGYNVKIGKGTIIEPNVTIHPDVIIGENCLIRSGSVIGFDGFEHKRTKKVILSVFHDGRVIIDNNVEVGSINSIAKGMKWRDTIIGENTKTDSLVHIAHGVQVGKNCLITACAEISGSVTIGDECWLGPNCSVINAISLGKKVLIGIGAVVTKSVPDNSVLAGNPAKLLRTEK